MTIIRPTNVRVTFDDKLIGNANLSTELAPGSDTEAFYDASKSDLGFAAARSKEMRGEFVMHMDIESEQRLKQFLMYPYQLEAMKRISNLAGRFQPFEFGPPMVHMTSPHRMNEDDNTRRFMVVKPSAYGKTEVLMRDHGIYGKIAPRPVLYQRPANVGKTTAMMADLRAQLLDGPTGRSLAQWEGNQRLKRAVQRNDAYLPRPRNTGIRAIVNHICNHWGDF